MNPTRDIVLCVAALLPSLASAETVELALDVNSGPDSSYPSYLAAYRGEIYFRSSGALQNNELWRFNGATASQVVDINPNGGSYPTDLTVASAILYFTAEDGAGQRRIWSWNGTTAAKVAGTSSVQSATQLIAFNGDLYFSGIHPTVGEELFKWDGTTLTMIDIFPGRVSSFPRGFVEYNGALYFRASGQSGQGSELWRYDGTTASKAGQNINPGNGSSIAWLTVFKDKLYFSASEPVHGNELWCFDGTSSSLVADKVPGAESFNPSNLTVFKNALYFSGDDRSGAGNELWKYDGSTILMVSNINPNPPGPDGDDWYADSTPTDFEIHDRKLYFLANDGTHGKELWGYTGSGAPQIVSDIHSGTSDSNPGGLRAMNYGLFLGAYSDAAYGHELYRLVPSSVVDSDQDGMPNDWEAEHGLNPALNDADADQDGDGTSNGAEFVAGTDPSNPASVFEAKLDAMFRLTWPSVPGKTYLVEENYGEGWEPFQPVSAAPAPAIHTVLKISPPTGGMRLFRVSVRAE
jgi:ELWxxDGT repeat protein